MLPSQMFNVKHDLYDKLYLKQRNTKERNEEITNDDFQEEFCFRKTVFFLIYSEHTENTLNCNIKRRNPF